MKHKKNKLDDKEFYDLMQKYRCAPITNQEETIEAFEDVKRWIRRNFSVRIFK